MMKGIDVCYIKLFLRTDLEKNNGSLLRDGNFEVYGQKDGVCFHECRLRVAECLQQNGGSESGRSDEDVSVVAV